VTVTLSPWRFSSALPGSLKSGQPTAAVNTVNRHAQLITTALGYMPESLIVIMLVVDTMDSRIKYLPWNLK